MIKPNELKDLKLDKDQQLAVYYRGVWCGRFKKGVIPDEFEIVEKITANGFYICEVKNNLTWAVELKIMDDEEVELVKELQIPEGYVLMPKELTDEMITSLRYSRWHWGDDTKEHFTPLYEFLIEIGQRNGDD